MMARFKVQFQPVLTPSSNSSLPPWRSTMPHKVAHWIDFFGNTPGCGLFSTYLLDSIHNAHRFVTYAWTDFVRAREKKNAREEVSTVPCSTPPLFLVSSLTYKTNSLEPMRKGLTPQRKISCKQCSTEPCLSQEMTLYLRYRHWTTIPKSHDQTVSLYLFSYISYLPHWNGLGQWDSRK